MGDRIILSGSMAMADTLFNTLIEKRTQQGNFNLDERILLYEVDYCPLDLFINIHNVIKIVIFALTNFNSKIFHKFNTCRYIPLFQRNSYSG